MRLAGTSLRADGSGSRASDVRQRAELPISGAVVRGLGDRGPNGGYLAAIALRAAGEVAEIKRPASFYCHFLSSPAFDVVELKVSVLKQGRRAESFAVEMTQQGKPILHAMVKTAAEAPGYSHQHPSAPAVPLPETLKTYEELFPASPPFSFWENVERRPVDQSTTDEPQAPLVQAWTRFRPTARFEDPSSMPHAL